MYSVVRIENNPHMVQNRFKSASLHQCWEFVKNQNNPNELYVLNRIGEFMDPPEDVRCLINYQKLLEMA